MAININAPIKVNALDDNESFLPDVNLNYGPYSSKSAAITAITSNYGSASNVPLGVKFAVVSSGTLTEYQWKSGSTFNAINCTEIGASSGSSSGEGEPSDLSVDDYNNADFAITDGERHVLAEFINGHIKTRNFNSSTFNYINNQIY